MAEITAHSCSWSGINIINSRPTAAGPVPGQTLYFDLHTGLDPNWTFDGQCGCCALGEVS